MKDFQFEKKIILHVGLGIYFFLNSSRCIFKCKSFEIKCLRLVFQRELLKLLRVHFKSSPGSLTYGNLTKIFCLKAILGHLERMELF